MSDTTYTGIKFVGVQELIENSHSLRDLYGSLFIISYLANAVCEAAKTQGFYVVSPAITNVLQGIPNEIIIRGLFQEKDALVSFYKAWKKITRVCKKWIEDQIPGDVRWRNEWNLWTNHGWEVFWVQGESITNVLRKLNSYELSRKWVGINCHGESSILSGMDAIAYFGMGSHQNPKEHDLIAEAREIRLFYKKLNKLVPDGNAFVDEREQLSILELVKRLVTYDVISKQLNLKSNELPSALMTKNFRDINYSKNKCWTGWFQGNINKTGNFFTNNKNQEEIINQFSERMLIWGNKYLKSSIEKSQGRLIYANGNDFLGVFYSNATKAKLNSQEYLRWLYHFPDEWHKHNYTKDITISIGFLWAAPGVSQQKILQHCQEAEKSAKQKGGDRITLRILFKDCNWIEWVCPWWFLQDVLEGYNDRNKGQNWNHIYSDITTLESRHAFGENKSEVALAVFQIYFGANNRKMLEKYLWNHQGKTGILGNHPAECQNLYQSLNKWIVHLAKVGFYLNR